MTWLLILIALAFLAAVGIVATSILRAASHNGLRSIGTDTGQSAYTLVN
ncbi:MAG: hypothetical protein JWQ43_353 [Glaciihabitans sp.]|nr:hypothetical protein [Glaciihabitans sp.]